MLRVFRAKNRALDLIEGTTNEQFGMLYAYEEVIMSSNPGTRVVIKAKPVVGSENQLVGKDLDIVNSHAWTFMNDKQKGLIDAVSELFPNASHRFCVRHLYNNFKGNFKGNFKKADLNAYKWLGERPPINWSRSHFSTFPKCDILLNNLCESFNSAILIARDQSIISMLERIRHILTEMVVKRREAMKKCMGDICPKIYKLVEKMKGHVVAAYNLFDQEPLDHVHQCYSKATYLKTYDNMLAPLNGKELWTTSLTQVMLPPDVCRRAGRPKKAKRRELEEEATVPPDPTELGRKGTKMTCSRCGVQGHNKRSCKTKEPVKEQSAPVDEMAEQSAHGTSGAVQETVNAAMGSGIKLTQTKPKRASKLTVRRQMNKTKHNQVEQNKGITLSQPQSQVDDPVPS
ncbi:hypothetical protein Vadar_014637 [Vaccinium darrowii]|uniref:Uncharacterized protein n=1 Tax=Vaccinium darrowii TaxID=229202 RepID=A0ACB7Z3N6_9ERIC|nr:hypothetical protein Vadar_014637 [Vaccinium darrowii]